MDALVIARNNYNQALDREAAAIAAGTETFAERRAVTNAALQVIHAAATVAGLDPIRVEEQVATSAAAVRRAADRMLMASHLAEPIQ